RLAFEERATRGGPEPENSPCVSSITSTRVQVGPGTIPIHTLDIACLLAAGAELSHQGRVVRRGRHPGGIACCQGRLMRHFPEPHHVSALAGRMGKPPIPGRLIPAARLAQTLPSRFAQALRAAVPVPPVTPAAEEENLPALWSGACDKAQRVHRTSRAPACGAAPRSAVLLRSSRAPLRTPWRAGPGGPSSSVLEGLSFVGNAQPCVLWPHRQSTSFRSPRA